VKTDRGDAVDLEEEFRKMARDTAEQCRNRGKTEREFSDVLRFGGPVEGVDTIVRGWEIHTDRERSEKKTPGFSGDSEFFSSRTWTLILSTAGEVWELWEIRQTWQGPEYEDAYGEDPHHEVRNVLRPAASAVLVGASG
jgi:hypothetical protein